MDSVKVSVIVPVYNASLHLRECLDSIVNQTLKETEIICVDDGSLDDSPEILKEYQEKDSRVRLLSQKNSYAGVARNKGMEEAQGKYLIFWDSDDFFHPEALEKLYAKCEEDQAQIGVCGAFRYFDEEKKASHFEGYLKSEMLPENLPFSCRDIPDYIFNFTCEAAWNKLFLRSFVEEKGLRFHPTRNGNDLYFTMMALAQADRITVVKEDLVNYRRQQEGSLVSTLDRAAVSILEEWLLVKEDLQQKDLFFERSYQNKVLTVIMFILQLSESAAAYREKTDWLEKKGLNAFDLREREEGYYYSERNAEFLSVLLKEGPEELLIRIIGRDYWKMETNRSRIQSLRQTLEKNREKLSRSQEKLQKTEEKLTEAREKLQGAREKLQKKEEKQQELEGKLASTREKLVNTREKLESVREKYESARKELEDIKNSSSYKMAKTVTALPRKLKK